MIPERTIHICGKDVRVCYCAATENGFEMTAGKSIYEIDFKSQADLTYLSLAAIVAAYAKTNEEAPIKGDDLLYEAAPKDIINLFAAVLEMRNEWYEVPKVVPPDTPAEPADGEKTEEAAEDKPKN